jgi:hypothetical protein
VLILAPCGHSVEQTLAEVCTLAALPGWWSLPAVHTGQVRQPLLPVKGCALQPSFCSPIVRARLSSAAGYLETDFSNCAVFLIGDTGPSRFPPVKLFAFAMAPAGVHL